VAADSPSPNGQSFQLPSYKDQSPEVKERFQRIYQRPVVMNVKALGKVFESGKGPVEVLQNINFQIHRREFICILGQSGCGKSTLIRMFAGLEEPTSGTVEIAGQEEPTEGAGVGVMTLKPVEGPGPDRGMVFQSYTLFPWLTVKKTSCLACGKRELPKRPPKKKPKNGSIWSG